MARIQRDVTLGGRFRLVERIAAGGMGAVWAADDRVLHRRVAVKVLSEALGSDPQFVERFRREARAAAGLSHPNIAGVYDYGEESGTPFIVMELIEGETLADRLAREGRLETAEAARIAADVAGALQTAHDAGVVHRDVKPGNVMLDPHGRVRVMDFGIAAASWAAPITATGTTLGTASYLSPEQAAGERATPASDVYSLGCVLYEMLTGRPPFVGDSPVAVAAAHARETPRPVRELAPAVPAGLAQACEAALAKSPAARPAPAAAFGDALGEATRRAHASAEATGTEQAGPDATTVAIQAPTRTAVLPAVAGAPAMVDASPASAEGSRPRAPNRSGLWILGAVVIAAGLVALLVAAVTGGGGTPARPPPATTAPPARTNTVKVPQVVGAPVRDALKSLADAGITHVEIQTTDQGSPGVVADVQPEEGSSIDPDQTVTLFVGAPRKHGKGNDKGGKGHD